MTAQSKQQIESRQADGYDEIVHDYTAHYSDEWAQRYRSAFFNRPMVEGLDLYGKRVLEAMCGTGQTTEFLLDHGAQVTGLDISPKMVEGFRKKYGARCQALCGSVTETGLPDESFDAVVIVGGLHHVQPYVQDALDEIHRILVPGGHLCFVEPHAGSLPDIGRKIWYRLDSHFEDNEASIDLAKLEEQNRDRFDVKVRRYSGGVAYPFVCTSLIWRIPLAWKKFYSKPLLALEKKLSPLSNKRLSFFVACQWQKR